MCNFPRSVEVGLSVTSIQVNDISNIYIYIAEFFCNSLMYIDTFSDETDLTIYRRHTKSQAQFSAC